jgi:hypothetical protein
MAAAHGGAARSRVISSRCRRCNWRRAAAAAAIRVSGLGVEHADGRDAPGDGEREKGEGEQFAHNHPVKHETYNELRNGAEGSLRDAVALCECV